MMRNVFSYSEVTLLLLQIADWAFDKLQPGGKVVLGNFNLEQNCKAATGTLQHNFLLGFRPSDIQFAFQFKILFPLHQHIASTFS